MSLVTNEYQQISLPQAMKTSQSVTRPSAGSVKGMPPMSW